MSLPSSMADFVLWDRLLQKAYFHILPLFSSLFSFYFFLYFHILPLRLPLFLVLLLKAPSLFLSRSSLVGLDHNRGPIYFKECFRYFTELKARQDEVQVPQCISFFCLLYIPRQEVIFGFKHHYNYILQPSVGRVVELFQYILI